MLSIHRPIRTSVFFLFLLSTYVAFGQGTRTWEQSKFEDFEKGTTKGVAIRNDGYLELAPAFRPLATTQSTYLWSVGSDDRGNVFAAAGAPSRVYAHSCSLSAEAPPPPLHAVAKNCASRMTGTAVPSFFVDREMSRTRIEYDIESAALFCT